MKHNINPDMEVTLSMSQAPRQELVDVLEAYVADLERGAAPDQEALLAAHPKLADELRPYLDSLRLLDGAARELRLPEAEGEGTCAPPAPRTRQIGDYRISREIGRGGMGVVYEAHQKSLNRRVALKILPFAAVLDQRQIARFQNEAQAAAQLHHPHIVPVFAVGQEQGVYYYAMQYIDGQSLEQAIGDLKRGAGDRGVLSTQAAGAVNGSTTTIHLEGASILSRSYRSIRHGDFFESVARLGREAALALQHAHEYGIIHRDIKPSNLLIDHQGKLWVTDFGLARMQSGGGVTLTGDVVGTLRYMSPEQASGRSEMVDTRTDVYSLGVTLYELMTLEQAFQGDDRQAVLRAVERDEPRPPRQINPAVPIDLETIVLQAMSKSRDERYQSARELAEDLERFLAGKPTQARRPNLVDRATKWARRHRALVAVGAAACLLLTLVSSGGMVLLAREKARTEAAASEARENFQRAEDRFRQAQDVVDHGVRMADRLMQHPGTEGVRYQWLTDTLHYYHDFLEESSENPQLRHESALAHFKSGMLAAKLGQTEEAIAHYRSSQRFFKTLVGAAPKNDEYWQQLASTHNNLGLLLAARDEEGARAEYERAIAIQQRLVDDDPHEASRGSQLAESRANLGMLFEQLGERAAAERSLRAAVDLLRPIAARLRDQPKYARNLAIACNNLSYVLREGDVAAAERIEREAVAILESLNAKYSQATQYKEDLALCYNNLAALVGKRGDDADALEWHSRAAEIQEQLVRIAPDVVRHRSELAVSLNNLGVAYCRAGEPEEADAAFNRAREIFTTLAEDFPDALVYQGSLAGLLNNQALALAGASRYEEALAIYPEAISAQRTCWELRPDSEVLRDALSRMYYNYAESLRKVGRLGEAAGVAVERRELWKGEGERLYGVAVELADIGGELRKHEKTAEESARESDTPEASRSGSPGAAPLTAERVDAETVATLALALEVAPPEPILAAAMSEGERFAHLRRRLDFNALLASLGAAERDSEARGEGAGERVQVRDATSATSD